MRKAIAASLGIFIFMFLFSWYYAEIYCRITPFLLIYFYPVILIVIMGGLSYSIFFVVKYAHAFRWKATLPLTIVAATIGMMLFFPFEKAKVLTEFLLYTRQREAVVASMKQVTSATGSFGDVVLPEHYRHLSCDGNVNLERNEENKLIVGFWVFRGLSINGYSMVYYNSTKDQDTLTHEIGEEVFSITKLNDEWYYVVTE